jgi:chloramphenicol 3-O phosphotransferase
VTPGQVIVLCGTSSAGKSTIAAALQRGSRTAWHLTGTDAIWATLPASLTRIAERVESDFEGFTAIVAPGDGARRVVAFAIGSAWRRGMEGLHEAVRDAAASGHSVVVDVVFFDDALARHAAACWAPLHPLFVGVRPPLAVSERWEAARPDRMPGQAATAYGPTHAHGAYDLEVDPSTATPEACAEAILAALAAGAGGAMARLAVRP